MIIIFLLLQLSFIRLFAYTNDPDCNVYAVALLKDNNKFDYKHGDISYGDASLYHYDTKRLGGGAYGDIYKGYNKKTNKKIVLKVYHKFNKEKMFQEIMITQDICGGYNIIKLLDVIEFTNSKYPTLVIEYIHNDNNDNIKKLLSPTDIQIFSYQFLRALDYIHTKNIIHYDIKPDNLIIDYNNNLLKLIDFGLSRYYTPGTDQHVAGTLNYKSPEMLTGYKQFNQSTDMWSFGCIFAEWLFRLEQPLFHGGRTKNQLNEIAKVLGTKDLIRYYNKYNIDISTMHDSLTIIHHKKRHNNNQFFENTMAMLKSTPTYNKVPFKSFINKENKHYVTDRALDLLQKILIYDHGERLTAAQALRHPYFEDIFIKQSLIKAINSSEIFPPG